MLNACRFTLQMPACCTICATARVEPGVNGSSAPSEHIQNRSMIAVGRIRSHSPISVTSYPASRN
jgi:hypothetical protein